jgi:phage baseplate assembly protein gpV/phage protein D
VTEATAARPRAAVSLPALAIDLDGEPLAAQFARTLSALRVEQRLDCPVLCEVTFVQRAGSTAGMPITVGMQLRARIGRSLGELFVGDVTAVEHEYGPGPLLVVRVRAYDVLHRLRKRQPVRAHVQVTAAELARELTGDLDISVVAPVEGPLWPRITQHRQTDLEILEEAVARAGLHFSLRGDTLHLITMEGAGDAVPLRFGESLLEVKIVTNADQVCRSVTAVGWDPSRGAHHSGTSRAARSGRRIAAEAPIERFGDTSTRTLLGELAQADEQMDAVAQGELDARTATEVELRGLADGEPLLRPGMPVEVSGVAPELEGRYVLATVIHQIDPACGYVTEFNTRPPVLRRRSTAAGVAPGVVTRVDDPEGLGRVQVSLPLYRDLETDWLSVVIAGAGGGKGLVMLPDVGDDVLVLCAQADPTQGIVLGGLYGARQPPGQCVDENSVRHFLMTTSGGQFLRLDDVNGAVVVENRIGSRITLSPDSLIMHAESDLTIEAPGRAIVIRARTVDFEQA